MDAEHFERSKMALVTLKTMLDKVCQNGSAVGAFNVINLNFLEASILVARRTASPVVLNILEVHIPFVTLENQERCS